MNYILGLAKKEEIPKIFDLYRKRIDWMNKKGIRQWNMTDYLSIYPMAYYEEHCKNGGLFVLREEQTEQVVAAAVLLDQDERWTGEFQEDNVEHDLVEENVFDQLAPASYIHNLVTACDVKGAGKQMIQALEELAVSRGKKYMRLDCAQGQEFLNQYYEALGYHPAGAFTDGSYHGIRREKNIHKEMAVK